METFRTENYIFAQSGIPGENEGLSSSTSSEPAQIQDLFGSVDKVLGYLLPIGIIISVAFIIMGGYMWMSSAGNPEKVKQAQGTLTWAIIGLVFVLIAALLVRTLVDYIIGM